MKTRKENSVNLENKSFNLLKKDELIKIKGGTEDEYLDGIDTVRLGDFE